MHTKMKVRALLVSAVLVIGTAVVGAPSVSAETLYRDGAKKVTIYPEYPGGDYTVTKARITVKKGKKTVAKNKKTYRAKKGTYKVTSTITYFYPETVTWVDGVWSRTPDTTRPEAITEADLSSEQCVVTGRTVQNRSVQVTSYDTYFGEATLDGQADVTYTGACTAHVYDSQLTRHDLAWTDEWTETKSVYTWVKMFESDVPAFDVSAWLNTLLAANDSELDPRHMNDVVPYPGNGTELDKAPKSVTATIPGNDVYTAGYTITVPGTPSTTVKSARTVVVK